MSEPHASLDDPGDALLTEAFLRVMCRARADDDPRDPVYTDAELDGLGGVSRNADRPSRAAVAKDL
jgi:hypothetical protein